MPRARAAGSSSRDARTRRQNLVCWKSQATTIAISAQASAEPIVVLVGTPAIPVEPPVNWFQFAATMLMMFRSANVPRPAVKPPRRISGSASDGRQQRGEQPADHVGLERRDVGALEPARQLQQRLLRRLGDPEQPRGVGADRHEADVPEGEDALLPTNV
jgi:hypothetical protein